ncbi:MAG TPA: hypothetical protein VHZ51_28680 [Ktedonobacteraceae bacterium]|jgi:hypothetical protein|nr:hypothetical protein [Ktedonobacteraceae bacterium]
MGLFSAVINGIEHVADDFEKLMGKALNELESLGLSATGSIGPFVKFLMELGEDPVVVIEHMANHIRQIDGDVVSTLEEVASGVISQGLTGFATSKLTQVVEPVKTALQKQSGVGSQVASVHQTTLRVMQSRLNTLTVSGNTGTAWQGAGAQAMLTNFSGLSTSLTSLNTSIDTGGAQDTLNNACLRALDMIGELAIGLAVIDLLLLVVEAVVAVATAGTAVVVEAPLDAGVVAAEIELILGLVAADLVAWVIGTIGIQLVQIATTHTTTSAPAKPQILQLNLPKEPHLTPEQQGAVEDLVRELAEQLGVNPESLANWLKLIVQALGAGATAAQIKSVVRCLASKGYLDASNKRAWNNVADHLTPRDLQGAWGDNNGYDTSADHQNEVGRGLDGLERFIKDINLKLKNYNLSPAKRAYYNTLKATAQKTIDYVKPLINLGKKQGPSTKNWEEPKGRVPFPQDILEVSGCLR